MATLAREEEKGRSDACVSKDALCNEAFAIRLFWRLDGRAPFLFSGRVGTAALFGTADCAKFCSKFARVLSRSCTRAGPTHKSQHRQAPPFAHTAYPRTLTQRTDHARTPLFTRSLHPSLTQRSSPLIVTRHHSSPFVIIRHPSSSHCHSSSSHCHSSVIIESLPLIIQSLSLITHHRVIATHHRVMIRSRYT